MGLVTNFRFQASKATRWLRHRGVKTDKESYSEIASRLEQDGFFILKSVARKSDLDAIREESEDHLRRGTCLNPVSKDSERFVGEDSCAPAQFLSDDELARGPSYYRHLTNQVSVKDPLVSCRSFVKVALNDLLIDIATAYLGVIPAIGTINLRKSFVNSLLEFDTQLFHSDANSPRFLKFFFYLDDVDREGGPFCYVRGSHRRKFKGWNVKYRWTTNEIARFYSNEDIVELVANVGDLIIADTTGFHRGIKPKMRDRTMLTVNYTIHPEYWRTNGRAKIALRNFERLSPKQKAACDFLEIVARNELYSFKGI